MFLKILSLLSVVTEETISEVSAGLSMKWFSADIASYNVIQYTELADGNLW